MIPAVLIGLFFEETINSFFNGNLLLVAVMLYVTSVLLYLSDIIKLDKKEISYKNSFIIGLAQAIAILPGISRSGATIATAVVIGIDREKAARFSFIMVIPLIFGSMAKSIIDNGIIFENFSSYPSCGNVSIRKLSTNNIFIFIVKMRVIIIIALIVEFSKK